MWNSLCGREIHTGFWCLKEIDHLEDIDVDEGNNIIVAVKEIGLEDVDWIHMAQDRAKRWTFVNTVMKL
jgi:hypothetical protein